MSLNNNLCPEFNSFELLQNQINTENEREWKRNDITFEESGRVISFLEALDFHQCIFGPLNMTNKEFISGLRCLRINSGPCGFPRVVFLQRVLAINNNKIISKFLKTYW